VSGASFSRTHRLSNLMWRFALVALISIPATAQLLGGPDVPDEVGDAFEMPTVFGRPAADLPTTYVDRSWGPAGTAFVTPLAAHRDARGLRFLAMVNRGLPDGGTNTSTAEGPVFRFFEPGSLLTPDAGLYFRTWMRINPPVTNSRVVWFAFYSENGVTLDPLTTGPNSPGWRMRLADHLDTPAHNGLLKPATWHLVEMEYDRGRGPDGGPLSGTFRVWLDGQLHTRQPNPGTALRAPLQGGGTTGYSLGFVEHLNQDTSGSIDFDDFRRARRPPGSTLVLERLMVSPPVDCPYTRQYRLRLVSSQNTPALAPYAFQAAIDAGPGFQVGRLSAGCVQAGTVTLPVAADSVVFGVDGQSSGQLTAEWPDFLPAALSFAAVPFFDAGVDAGLPDAGFDAGSPDAGPADAGVPDAGVDSGLPDAGADAGVDAGVPDAGILDAGIDSGVADAGRDGGEAALDAGSGDAGRPDAGSTDAGVDAGQTQPRPLLGCHVGPEALAALVLVLHRRRRGKNVGVGRALS
jgi:hypothetical protein